MGTVYFNRQRGKYGIDYTAADGCRIRQLVGTGEEGRRKARQLLEKCEAEVVMQLHGVLEPAAQAQETRFRDFAGEWLERARARRLAPKTLESYDDTLEHHLLPSFADMRLDAIGRNDVDAYLVRQSQATKVVRIEVRGKVQTIQVLRYSTTTVNYALSVLKAILRDAADRGAIRTNPALRVKPVGRSAEDDDALEMQVLDPVAIARLLDVAEEPWRTLYLLAVNSGLRRGELLALRLVDVDKQKGLVHVRRQLHRVKDGDHYMVKVTPLKSRHSRRTVDVAPDVIAALEALCMDRDPREFIFRSRTGRVLDPDNVDRAYKPHLVLADIPEIRFHDLRHTHVGLLIAAGEHPKTIQARLGHASITTTLNTYGHLMPAVVQGVGRRVAGLLNGNGVATEKNAGSAKSTNPASVLVGPGGLEPPAS